MNAFLENEICNTIYMFTDRDALIVTTSYGIILLWHIYDDQDGLWDMFESNRERLSYFGLLKDSFDATYIDHELYVKYTLGPVIIKNNIYSQVILSYASKDHPVSYYE
jgi:hypothetical protein